MLFSSTVFLFFFLPVVFCGYYILYFSRKLQNIWLFIFSLIFYAWGEPKYVFLMLASILVNWFAGFKISQVSDDQRRKKRILIWACIINLSTLFIFKYLNFILSSINMLFDSNPVPEVNIRLPIGISFFTFQALSYVIDVYRNNTPAEKNPFYVGLYVSFFPQLIAGPIVRYSSIAREIHKRKSSFELISTGVCRFMGGFIKKVLLANNFAILADLIFNYTAMGQKMQNVPAMLAWLGIISYTLQIYFDFSAYSDMAIGLGKMFGFEFEENFNYPYFATSMRDFWNRWHISLTSWFREYLYFPLGGSKVQNTDVMIRNLFIVWLLTGIWHGAGWTFIFWGLWHFLFQVAERFFRYGQSGKHSVLLHTYTMLVVSFGWILFRAQNLYQAGVYFSNLFALNNNGFYSTQAVFLIKEYFIFLISGIVFSTPITRYFNIWLKESAPGFVGIICNICYVPILLLLCTISVSYLVRGGL